MKCLIHGERGNVESCAECDQAVAAAKQIGEGMKLLAASAEPAVRRMSNALSKFVQKP